MKYLKYIILVIFIFSSLITLSQDKKVRLKEGHIHHNFHLYRVIDIPIFDDNGGIKHFVSWMWDDLIPYKDQNYLLNLETQRDQKGIGSFINPTYDSLKLNYQGAMNSCPTGWFLPSKQDWDTLINTLNENQLKAFVNNNNGYKGYKTDTINDTIKKSLIVIKGSFYWTSTKDDEKVWGIEFDEIYNVRRGKADLGDFLSVRCIKKEFENEE